MAILISDRVGFGTRLLSGIWIAFILVKESMCRKTAILHMCVPTSRAFEQMEQYLPKQRGEIDKSYLVISALPIIGSQSVMMQ